MMLQGCTDVALWYRYKFPGFWKEVVKIVPEGFSRMCRSRKSTSRLGGVACFSFKAGTGLAKIIHTADKFGILVGASPLDNVFIIRESVVEQK
jgi:hypothetical protein